MSKTYAALVKDIIDERMTIAEAEKKYGICISTIRKRVELHTGKKIRLKWNRDDGEIRFEGYRAERLKIPAPPGVGPSSINQPLSPQERLPIGKLDVIHRCEECGSFKVTQYRRA